MSRVPAKPLVIGPHRVGPGERCFVIAEAGINHNGDTARAHRMVDIAASSGADAVKFQTFRPEKLVSVTAAAAPYQRRGTEATQREMLAALTLPRSAWIDLARHAAEKQLVFLSTAFDPASLDLLIELEVQALKVPSGELDNLGFIRELADRGLPLIVSTGLARLAEVETAVEAASAAPSVALLHCVTAYPAPVECSNLKAMVTLAEHFQLPVGWSDHTVGSISAVAAVALGASILEKHFTTDRYLPGPDHLASANPDDLAAYVAAVRAAESSLGDGVKRPVASELENLRFARRSYHALSDLRPGEVVNVDRVALLRPADGLPPSAAVVGRVVARFVKAGSPIVAEDLQ